MGLIFKNYFHLESGETFSSKSKLKGTRDIHGVKVPHREFQCLECDESEICKKGEEPRRKKGFECELDRACESCLKRITQIKHYTTEIIKLKRLTENEFGYMVSHYERDLDLFYIYNSCCIWLKN